MTKSKAAQNRSLPSWLVTGVVATLAVLYTLFVFLPTQHKTAALKSKKYELMQYVANRSKTNEKITQARQRQSQVEQVSLAWRENAPDVSETGRALSSITQQARQAGVTLQRFDPEPQVRLQTIAQQPIAVALEGDFEQVFQFLQRVETLPHRVWVSHLTLSPAGENTQTLRVEMTLTIFIELDENSAQAKST
ncbi:type IV pilus inner membrane component PilO [Anatilimnocola floriformis]|uniref:type 4a pilus biogenesis protein PilO n=1 Tax=Anatilimnocola floriformis TaxID=2948575 RepID=UPI0020C517F5|nr:type 4a pilus biogenesis protein PilO [Anatilimnocola floriformis]